MDQATSYLTVLGSGVWVLRDHRARLMDARIWDTSDLGSRIQIAGR